MKHFFYKDSNEYVSFYKFDRSLLNKHHIEMVSSNGGNLAVHYFVPHKWSGKTVLLLHGYFDHTGSLRNIINAMLAKGKKVASYDLRGHGLSDGKRAAIDDFCDYVYDFNKVVSTLKAHHFVPDEVIAHSTGAAICTDFLLQEEQCPFSKVIFVAPLVRPKNWKLITLGAKWLLFWKDELKRKYRNNTGDQQYAHFVRTVDPLQCKTISMAWVKALMKWEKKLKEYPTSNAPITIIQGNLDTTVDWKYNLPFLMKKFPNAKMMLIDGGRHQLFNDQADIKNIAIKMIQSS